MKRFPFFVLALILLITSTSKGQEIPQTEITNDIIHAKIYLPDSDDGYYRGSRFDWSGVIPELIFSGHSYFGQWFEKYDPIIHDAIMGPVEAFTPLDYDSAKPGESFVIIGIGALNKPDESPYSFSKRYEILDYGKWEVEEYDGKVEFIHKLNDGKYSYEYKKTVQLLEGEPKMVLKHTLRNLGRKSIETEVYNHNFFVIDNQPIGPDFEVKFPFTLSTDDLINQELATISGNKITFEKELQGKQSVFSNLKGFNYNDKDDYDIRIENRKTGAGVKITSNRPLSKLAFWSSNKTLSPEPYTHIKIKPGETFSWDILYEFYVL